MAYLDNTLLLILSSDVTTVRIFHLFQLPDFVNLELGVLSVMVNDAYLWIIPYSQHSFPLKLCVLFEEGILVIPVKKDNVPPIFISNYHRLIFVYFSLSTVWNIVHVVSIQYWRQTSIKLFNQTDLCSHYRLRCKGLCQN